MNTATTANQTVATEQIVNGVNVTALNKTIDAIGEAPAIAEFKFRGENNWKNGSNNHSHFNSFYGACEEVEREKSFNMISDEPPMLLGTDVGANPVEFILHGMASCMTTTIVYHAAARGLNVESLSSKFEGDINLHGLLGLDEVTPAGFREVRINFTIKTDATEETLRELCNFSPSYQMVKAGLPVRITFDMI